MFPKRRFPHLSVCLFVLSFVFLALQAVKADVTTNEFIDFGSAQVYDQNTQEWVLFPANTYHVVASTTADGNGGYHGFYHTNEPNLTGVGRTSGRTYRYSGAQNFSFNVTAGGTFNYTFIYRETDNSQGSG